MRATILKHKALVIVAVAVIVIGGYWYWSSRSSGTVAPQYTTAKVIRSTLVISVSGSGQVAASNQSSIQAQASGNVVAIPVVNNQHVAAGDLLVRLDTTNDERSVRNAEASLESARLSLQTLMQPATTSSILQAQASVAQAQQSLVTNQSNLASDYNNVYTAVSNTFIDLPTVMTGLNNVLYATTLNKMQADIDVYVNMAGSYLPDARETGQGVVTSYQTALAAYNQNLNDFRNLNVFSSTSTIESILTETYQTLKAVSAADSSIKNFLDLVGNLLQQNNQRVPSQLTADASSMQSYISTTNSRLSTVIQAQNALQSDKQAIAAANLSIAQTSASLAQLEAGPTALAIQAQQLNVKQAENSLADAQANLNYDYVRAPFAGVVTNITAKVGQPASGALATLLSDTRLAQATFNEVDIVNVKVGQQATITFDALPNVTLTGKVSQVDTLGTVVQGVVSYNVQVALDVPNPEVKPGMSDNLSIITNVRPDVLTVPNAAVTTKQGVSTVQVMGANGVPSTVQATTGLANNTMTEIVSGLAEGDAVVTKTTTGAAATAARAATTGGGDLGGLRVFGGGGGAGR